MVVSLRVCRPVCLPGKTWLPSVMLLACYMLIQTSPTFRHLVQLPVPSIEAALHYFQLSIKSFFKKLIYIRQRGFTRPEFFLLGDRAIFFFFLSSHLYSRSISSLPSCLWSLRIFPSHPGSRLTIFYRDASSALLQLVNQWLNFTSSRSHAFRCERKNTNPTLVRIELTTSALAGVQVTYSTTRATRALRDILAFLPLHDRETSMSRN